MANYALMDRDGVVVKVYENPAEDFVAEYNSENIPRIYPCPDEVTVGWIRSFNAYHEPPESSADESTESAATTETSAESIEESAEKTTETTEKTE